MQNILKASVYLTWANFLDFKILVIHLKRGDAVLC